MDLVVGSSLSVSPAADFRQPDNEPLSYSRSSCSPQDSSDSDAPDEPYRKENDVDAEDEYSESAADKPSSSSGSHVQPDFPSAPINEPRKSLKAANSASRTVLDEVNLKAQAEPDFRASLQNYLSFPSPNSPESYSTFEDLRLVLLAGARQRGFRISIRNSCSTSSTFQCTQLGSQVSLSTKCDWSLVCTKDKEAGWKVGYVKGGHKHAVMSDEEVKKALTKGKVSKAIELRKRVRQDSLTATTSKRQRKASLPTPPSQSPSSPPTAISFSATNHPFFPELSYFLACISPSLAPFTSQLLQTGITSTDELGELILVEEEGLVEFLNLIVEGEGDEMPLVMKYILKKGLMDARESILSGM